MDGYLRRTWVRIDLDNLSFNFAAIRRRLHPHTQIMGVVKADAYGHGAVAVASQLQADGADMLGVSNFNEALQLRQAGIVLPILILGYTPPALTAALLENDLMQTVYCHEQARLLQMECRKLNQRLKIHLKIDTGMSRLGFSCGDALGDLLDVCLLSEFDICGLFTHFSCADDPAFTSTQMSRFMAIRRELIKNLKKSYVTHCANSQAVIHYPYTHLDMVRPGLILYGQMPSVPAENTWGLKPVMSFHSVISQVKAVRQGDGVSYGHRYVADGDRTLAVVPVGYADGYPRVLSNQANALIHGQFAPLRGNVCMDMSLFDVTGSHASVGDEVVLFNEQMPLSLLADKADTITYEMMCSIGKRVPRVYVKNGVECGFEDLVTGHKI